MNQTAKPTKKLDETLKFYASSRWNREKDILTTGKASHTGKAASRAMREEENHMFTTLSFIGQWKQWYRVLRYRKGFGPYDSVRFGLWLARS